MKRSILIVLTLVAVAAALAISRPARADEIESGTLTLTGCGGGGGCPDATYLFDIGTTSATLTITIDGSVNKNNDLLTSVDLGFTPSKDFMLTSFSDSAAFIWNSTTSSLSNSGCGTKSQGAFVCASGSGVKIAQGGTYTFTWDYSLDSGASIDSVADVHIGANYGPHNGLIVSETGASTVTTPEPSSLSLLGIGLLGIPFFRRKTWNA